MAERFKYFPDQLLARMLLLKGDMENGDGYDNKKGNICWEGIFNLEKDVAHNNMYYAIVEDSISSFCFFIKI